VEEGIPAEIDEEDDLMADELTDDVSDEDEVAAQA
jgi:hypothetical protein